MRRKNPECSQIWFLFSSPFMLQIWMIIWWYCRFWLNLWWHIVSLALLNTATCIISHKSEWLAECGTVKFFDLPNEWQNWLSIYLMERFTNTLFTRQFFSNQTSTIYQSKKFSHSVSFLFIRRSVGFHSLFSVSMLLIEANDNAFQFLVCMFSDNFVLKNSVSLCHIFYFLLSLSSLTRFSFSKCKQMF